MKTRSIFLILVIGLLASCKNQAPQVEDAHLGKIYFDVQGNEQAQTLFTEGMLLLHSFEYEDARDAFLEAQKADPTMSLAYWGEAMTRNHALWQNQDQDAALEALAKFSENRADRKSKLASYPAIEQDIFEGAEILFGEGTKYDRDLAYRDHLAELTEKYPDQQEISAMYAISLLGASRNGRDVELYGKSAEIAQGIIEENPYHPGALHYLIHSYDDPEHAHLAKSAADSYAKVAPDATHALHMPSHIYVALGLWDEVINSNIASWNASVKRMQRKQLEPQAKSYHAFRWLHYGLLQKGEYDKAKTMLDQMEAYEAEQTNNETRGYLLGMKGAQLVATGNWNLPEADIKVDMSNHGMRGKASLHYLNGMKAFYQDDQESLESAIYKIDELISEMDGKLDPMGFPMCSAGGRGMSKLGLNMMQIAQMQLKAMDARMDGHAQKAKDWYAKACALDDAISYSYGPPSIYKPIHEAYADYLFELHDYDEAQVYYQKSLDRNPRRLKSLKGMKACATAANNLDLINSISKEIENCLAPIDHEEIMVTIETT